MNAALNLEEYKLEDLVEEYRGGCIKTTYALIKTAHVILYIQLLQDQGLIKDLDYFILGQGEYRQIHIIKKEG